jgi:hypothetical protein
MRRWRRESILDVYNLVLGAFLFLSPWLLAFGYWPARIDTWVTGLLLVAISVGALMAFAEWEEWVSLILGLWMIVSPFLLDFPHAAAMAVNIGVGCVVAYLALMELWLIHYGSEHGQTTH